MPQCLDSSCDRYLTSDSETQQYQRTCIVTAIVMYAGYCLFVVGFISPLILFMAIALTLPRWLINVHELFHNKTTEEINWFISLMSASPVPLSLLTLGYEETQSIHSSHHRFTASTEDFDAYHIRGRSWVVFLKAFTTPEQNFIRWTIAKGTSKELLLNLTIRSLWLILLAILGGWHFLWFWLFLRIVLGVSDFAFFRIVHYQQGEYGTFQLKIPDRIVNLAELIFGKVVIQAVINHDIHHQYPTIAVRELANFRAAFKQ